MKRLHFLFCMAFLILATGIVSAGSPDTAITTDITTASVTTEPERTGGSIFFETHPSGAMIQLDNKEMGTSPFTYYSEKTGTFDVQVQKKGYEDYRGTVTVTEGKRVVFSAVLTPVSQSVLDENTPAVPVTTVTTVWKSTLTIPTPWPTSPPASPVDPAAGPGAAAIGIAFFALRRR